MAFTKNPSVSTYQTKGVNLLGELNARGTVLGTDVDYQDCYPEIIKNQDTKEQSVFIRKRNGFESFISVGASIRGVFYWEDQSKLFVATGHNIKVYSIPTGTLSTTLTNIFPTTTSGDIGFTLFLYEDGIVKLVVTDGTTLSTVDTSNTVVAGADVDMPVHYPSLVFLDGYLFLVKTNSADLYNSDLNDPLAFSVDGFISAESIPDRATKVIKMNNYILVFGNDSIEYLWNAANEAPGSPLQRNDTPVKLTGLAGGIAQLGSKVFFVGDVNNSQTDVFLLEDFKITSIGTEFIRRFISSSTTFLYSGCISMDGRDFFVLNTGAVTFVYDIEAKVWHRWTWRGNTTLDAFFPMTLKSGDTPISLFVRITSIYKFSPTLYQDAGGSTAVQIVTNNHDFDMYDQKFMSRLTVVADKPTASNTLSVSWSDDDYQTFNTPVTLDLYQERPSINRLGRFRRRAFKFIHTANLPLRIKQVNVDLNLGQH